jgi:transmembrane sensor
MQQNSIKYLFQAYLNKTATPSERQAFLDLVRNAGQDEVLRAAMDEMWETYQATGNVPEKVSGRVFEKIVEPAPAGRVVSLIYNRRWGYAVAAAAVAMVAVASFFLYLAKPHTAEIAAHYIAPGGQKATLTLGDGRTILLDSAAGGTLARQGAAQIIKVAGGILTYKVGADDRAPVVYNRMETPRGGVYQLILPDGTHVWLNSASSIRYPNIFNGKERKVEITGEAYLQVAKNSKMPFVVSSRGMTVQVLGTEFNLMAYADEEAIRTTLVNGVVKVIKDGAGQLLRPGQQAVLDPGNSHFNTNTPDLSQVLAWKEGRFRFDGVKITVIMRQIARWYDVDVVYRGAAPDNEFNGSIKRDEDASKILDALELTGNVHFEVQGRKIIVIPGPR